MKSLMDPSIHIIGDAATGGEFPKSGFAANNEAKMTAMIIRADLTGTRRLPVRFTNHCWSTIAPDDAIKNGARYEPRDGRIVMIDPYTSQLEESAGTARQAGARGRGLVYRHDHRHLRLIAAPSGRRGSRRGSRWQQSDRRRGV